MRNIGGGHDPRHRHRGADEDKHDGGGRGGVGEDLGQFAPLDFAVDHDGQKKRVEHGDGAGLGGREPAADDTAHDDDDEGEAGEGGPENAAGFAEGDFLADGVAIFLRDETGDEHEAEAKHEAGNVAGDEEGGDGDAAAGEGVDDHDVARRDEQAGGGGGDVDGGGEVFVEALFFHERSHETAVGGGGGGGGTGDRTEEHVCEDIHVGEAAGKPADDDLGEGDQPVGDAAAVHEITREDEERNREQGKAVEAGGEALGDDGGGGGGIKADDEGAERGEPDGEDDRDAGQ